MIEILNGIKNIKSSRKELREFGLVIGVVLIFLGGIAFLRGKSNYLYFFYFGVPFAVLGLVLPSLLMPLQKVWMSFSVVAGFFMSRLILSVLFYLIITPISFIMKTLGKDILDEKIDKKSLTYWKEPKHPVKDKASYENQY